MIADRAPCGPQSKIGPEAIDPASLREIDIIDPASLRKIVAAIAHAQRALRSERTRAGLAVARQSGQRLGRPPALTETQVALARRMMVAGVSKRIIARTLKVSRSTIYLALKPYAGEAPKSPQKPRPPVRPRATTESKTGLERRMVAVGRAGGRKVGVPPKLTHAQARDAARRIAAGQSLVSTARNFGVRPMTLRATLRRHGLKPPSRKITKKQAASAARRVAGGESLTKAARALGVWPVTLIRTLRRYGFDFSAPSQPSPRNAA